VNDRRVAWSFVALQIVILGGLLLSPTGDLWPRPSWLARATDIALWIGVGYCALAAMWLRRALTPSPLPRQGAQLVITGPFRLSRHPIYLGVLVVVISLAARRAGVVALILALAAIVFFSIKARWEERRLTATYPGYAAYAARTGRIVPRWR